MKTFLKKLYRVFAGPQIGDVYVRNRQEQNPFKEEDKIYVEIIDKKCAWVQFKHIKFCKNNIIEWEIKLFKQNFTFHGRSCG